jgi:selenocysteine lyase/cysteine desulfurase
MAPAMKALFLLDPDVVFLNHGSFGACPKPVFEALQRHQLALERNPVEFLGRRSGALLRASRQALAAYLGARADDLVFVPNATTGVNVVARSFPLQPGDEVLTTDHEYGACEATWERVCAAAGATFRRVEIPLPFDRASFADRMEAALGPRTRLVFVSHLSSTTALVFPLAELCSRMRARGVPVLVDGAHSFAQLEFRIPDLGCDYFGASLHKWLGVPLGAGILYVRRDRIAPLWPVFGDAGYADDDIRKLNHTGTHPVHTDLAIRDAIAFHEAIGLARKEARLRFLQQHWTRQVRGVPRIVLNTPTDPARACAIANVGVEGMAPATLAQQLFDRHRIWTVAIDGAGVRGVRVTPGVFTTTAELDRLVAALTELARG